VILYILTTASAASTVFPSLVGRPRPAATPDPNHGLKRVLELPESGCHLRNPELIVVPITIASGATGQCSMHDGHDGIGTLDGLPYNLVEFQRRGGVGMSEVHFL
jgi:hypothetical protein